MSDGIKTWDQGMRALRDRIKACDRGLGMPEGQSPTTAGWGGGGGQDRLPDSCLSGTGVKGVNWEGEALGQMGR